MKKGNFLINKNTKSIYKIMRVYRINDAITFRIQRCGDLLTKNYSETSLKNKFYVIDKQELNDVWMKIANYTDKFSEEKCGALIFQYDFKMNIEDGTIKTIHINDVEDEIYNKIDEKLYQAALENYVKETEFSDKNIKSFLRNKKNNALEKMTKDKPKTDLRKNNKEKNEPETDEINFLVIEPEQKYSFDNIILHQDTRDQIDQVLINFELKDFMMDEWSNDRINETKRYGLNLYGPPGTGKTISVKAIANKFQKKILQVDFSDLISKYVGDTGKHIKAYFEKARQDDLILFFDEADTLLQKRSSDSSQGHYVNQNQNIFMQEYDRFEGIVILTTNFFENYDKAQDRRFNSIEYKLPTQEMRLQIIRDHIPHRVKLSNDLSLDLVAKNTEEFSGGDIKKLIENVLNNKAASVRKENFDKSIEEVKNILREARLSWENFQDEINRIQQNKNNYAKNKVSKNSKKIGLMAS